MQRGIIKPKILFIGGTPRGRELLKVLLNQGEKLVFAYLMQEDKHEKVKASFAMRRICRQYKVPFKVTRRLTRDDGIFVDHMKADVAFVCGWRTIIPPEIYERIPLGCMAAHDSLLPKYRGFAPLNWSIINGEKQTGVTLFKITDGPFDSGPVFRQKRIPIGPLAAAVEVYQDVIKATIDLYQEYLAALKKNAVRLNPQNEKQATYTCKRTPEDGEIDWTKSAGEVFNFVRALEPPYPCAWTVYDTKKILVERAVLIDNPLPYIGNIPGRVAGISKDGVVVLCGTGQVLLKKLRFAAGRHPDIKKYFSLSTTLGR